MSDDNVIDLLQARASLQEANKTGGPNFSLPMRSYKVFLRDGEVIDIFGYLLFAGDFIGFLNEEQVVDYMVPNIDIKAVVRVLDTDTAVSG